MGDESKNKNTDASLVKRVLAGDQRAFALLVSKHQGRLNGLVTQMLLKAMVPLDNVEDIVSESFVRAYNGLKGFRGDSEFYTWMYRITKRHTYNFITKYKKTQGLFVKSTDHSGSGFDTTDGQGGDDGEIVRKYKEMSVDDPYNEYVASETRDRLLKCIDNLPNDLRETVLLCEFSTMSYQDIADATNTNVGTVKSRIFRARRQLFECLGIERS